MPHMVSWHDLRCRCSTRQRACQCAGEHPQPRTPQAALDRIRTRFFRPSILSNRPSITAHIGVIAFDHMADAALDQLQVHHSDCSRRRSLSARLLRPASSAGPAHARAAASSSIASWKVGCRCSIRGVATVTPL